MIEDLLAKAVDLGADRLEIEYKDGAEWITAFRGPVGVGIGRVDSAQSKALLGEIDDLKRRKRIILDGNTYRLKFSKYESFGEWVYVIAILEDKRPP